MPKDPLQLELDLLMAPQPLDDFCLKAKVALHGSEVRYDLIWTGKNGGRHVQSCFLDAVWPIDKMSIRIITLIGSCHDGDLWDSKKVRSVLNAVQSAYGCEEPF